ncbi:MAG: glycosyltransferase family 4 protein [Oscillospiraceae bacterium]|nr:glycosyltransferase family 4 protein [Oscillospiraceae bacterium]
MRTIVVVSNVTSGLFSFRRELIERLAKTERVVILAKDTGNVERFRDYGCEFHEMDIEAHGKDPIKELRLLLAFRKFLRELRPDVVLTYTIKPNVYAGMACASLGIPYVANITGLGTAVENGGLMQKLTLSLYRRGLRKAQMVFFQNKENERFLLERGIVKGRYDLLPGSGVNLERYEVLPYPQGETVDFVFIGRLIREKGIEQYLEAAQAIQERHPETRFHICGSMRPAYEKKVAELHEKDVVIYHGHVSDIAEIHAMSACTVHPTYYPEGMSNVLLESCACGRPIITTDRPGCREIVDEGVNGLIVRQKDSADLIAKLEVFLSLPWEKRREMGLAGRAKVEREFDRKIVLEKYMREIENARPEL